MCGSGLDVLHGARLLVWVAQAVVDRHAADDAWQVARLPMSAHESERILCSLPAPLSGPTSHLRRHARSPITLGTPRRPVLAVP